MNNIQERWKTSKSYRGFLIAAIIYAVLRLAMQVYLFSDALRPGVSAEETQVSADLQRSYIPAAQHFRAHEDIYLKGSLKVLEDHFPYSPAFAFFFGPILLLPLNILVPLLVILHIAAYWLLYIWWDRIFQKNNLENVAKMWAGVLPLFLVFSAFWDDLGYLNIYLLIALLATFAIDAVMQEKLGWAVLWLAVILSIKPHWAFALALPLLIGNYRFFFKLLAGAIVVYLLIAGVTILAGGVSYGIQQYKDYIGFLARLSRDFPWRGPDAPFLGYDQSVKQTFLYYFGISTLTLKIVTILKVALLIPLGWISVKFLRLPQERRQAIKSETKLALAFAFYLGAFIWLDNVWEISLGLVVFAYFLATTEKKWAVISLWILFAPYALVDIWRLVTYIIFGDDILYQGAYLLTDPILYIPWITAIILGFYTLSLKKLNAFLNQTA
ncbi:MAG: DUF2029 domain-containing protein [Anaerolineales bacterium]|nr:DUF2029 domain-containing protein [Anaerolineales bacterium]